MHEHWSVMPNPFTALTATPSYQSCLLVDIHTTSWCGVQDAANNLADPGSPGLSRNSLLMLILVKTIKRTHSTFPKCLAAFCTCQLDNVMDLVVNTDPTGTLHCP